MDYSPLAREGLILVSRITEHVDDSRALRRDAERGLLFALRRGAFVERSTWDESDSRARHLLRARAAIAAASRPCALSGLSAAAVWGMPIAGDWPAEVTMLDEWRGGGRSEPGVRKTAAGFATAQTVVIDGIRVTSLARTALDVARQASFSDAVGSVDWALWRKNRRAVTVPDLIEELELLHPRTGGRQLLRVIGFATALSDSFGESTTRAVIHQLGFAPPELQVEFRDAEGRIVPDFFWREARQAAEFDGKVKYTRSEFTKGDPVEVLWKEKKREDRLRRLGCGVTRILTEHVAQPRRLERLLLDAGIPRGGEMSSRRES